MMRKIQLNLNGCCRALCFIAVLLLVNTPPVIAAEKGGRLLSEISGKVQGDDGVPIVGATLSLTAADYRKEMTSNQNGLFAFKDLNAGIYSLTVSMIGYQSYHTEIVVKSQDEQLDIVLLTSSSDLEEVVIVGYGSQKKSSLTSAVETVTSKKIVDRAVPSVLNILQGQAAGLNIQQTDGNPAAGNTTVNIRGNSTLSNNPVLYIVDGMAVSNLNYLNPADIESVSVLKDASAAAIYGARASGGVLLVTTKKGAKNSKAALQYSAMLGSQKPARLPKFVDAPAFVDLYNQAQLNDNPNASVKFTPELIQKYKSGELPSTNWIPYILNNQAFQQQHNLSVRGGGESVDYFVSGGFLDQDGLIKNVGYTRYNTRVNLNVQLNDRFKVGINSALVKEDRLQPSSYGVGSALQWSYIVPVTEFPYTKAGNDRSYRGGAQPNDIMTKGGTRNENINTVNTNFLLEYKILEELMFNATYGYNYRTGFTSAFYNKYPLYDDNEQIVTYVNNPNSTLKSNFTEIHPTVLLTLNYNKIFGHHAVKGLLGYSQEQDRNDFNQIRRYGFITNNIDQVDGGSNDPTLTGVTGNATSYAIQSVFGRVNYDFKNRYLFEASARYDGSSVFKNKRYGFFPSMSAGWIVSEESFMNPVSSSITYFKLRGSIGQVGNQNASGLYPWANTIAQGSYILNKESSPTIYYNNSPNADLTWEVKTTTNIGLDMSLWRNVSISADIFRDVTTDILRSPSVPTTFGISAPQQNVGKMQNQGFEISLAYRNKVGELDYNIGLNFSDSKDKILDLGGTAPTYGDNPIVAGQSRWMWYGLEAEGLFQSQAEIDKHAKQNPRTQPGDIKFKDVNEDGQITPDDRVFLGQATPHYRFGLSFDFAYKNFDLSVLTQGVLNNQLRVSGGAQVPFFYNGDGNILTSQLDYWSPSNPDARYPILRTDQSVNNAQFSNWWLFKASYLRVKNVQLGYRLPQQVLGKLKLSSVRVFAAADNLLVLTSKNFPKVLDPEIPNYGDGSNYPQVRNISFGLTVGF